MSIKLDGKEVKVGDRLFSLNHGWGRVSSTSYSRVYPILFVPDFGAPVACTLEGKINKVHTKRALFWDEIAITPPAPPKKKVKKYKVLVQTDRGGFCVSVDYYKTMEDYDLQFSMAGLKAIYLIPESMKEVEEV